MAQQNTVEKSKAVRKLEPTNVFRPFEQMDRMLEETLPHAWWRRLRGEWPWPDFPSVYEGRFPRVDVIDRDSEIVVRAEVPGIDKKDIDVSLTNGSVTIKGETTREEKEEKGDYYRCERTRGSFSRTVSLPAEVDSDTAKASFKDGLLELVLHKAEKSKRRSIKVD
jgi:HSP20 family protein